MQNYGTKDMENLKDAFQRIGNRLGGLKLKEALAALSQDDLHTAAAIALDYYDKAYAFGYNERLKESKTEIEGTKKSNLEIAEALISAEVDLAKKRTG